MSPICVLIKSLSAHPDATKLKICVVSSGDKELSVVCGATNARVGMKTILAEAGCSLKSGIIVRPANVRGVASPGMLCSAKDLGISQESGIVDLPPQIAPGTRLDEIPTDYLSSVPWYAYKEVEVLWLSHDKKELRPQITGEPLPFKNGIVLSKTYFHDGKYLYRNFKTL
jgi:tRNA-binding EMAP/Myf-like protein